MDAAVDLVATQSKYFNKLAPELPQYCAIHLEDNHGGTDDLMRGQDSALSRLLDVIDMTNSVVVLTGE